MRVNQFPFKIFHDSANYFVRANKSPELSSVKSILLDQDSKVIFAGNPMESEAEYSALVDLLTKSF